MAGSKFKRLAAPKASLRRAVPLAQGNVAEVKIGALPDEAVLPAETSGRFFRLRVVLRSGTG